ncbi:hypothetical protein DEO72_LG1g2351 [Vigna unguiculata]|uniref:Uncharacterized protein n=1 Tax=Vigna unguiculata TaxID=3917 RepID=A0A4D6KQ49_VIGUN|nr:hypothetical protein DEO72_LG1g2351 [Vigna unguiculata]
MTGGSFVNNWTNLTSTHQRPDVNANPSSPLCYVARSSPPCRRKREPPLQCYSSAPWCVKRTIGLAHFPLRAGDDAIAVFFFVSVVCETEYWPRSFSPPCRRRRHCRRFEPNILRFRPHFAVFFFVSVVCETEYWPRSFSPPCRRRRHCRRFEPNILRFRPHFAVFFFVSVVCETEYWPRSFSPPCRRRRHCRRFEPNILRFRPHFAVFFFVSVCSSSSPWCVKRNIGLAHSPLRAGDDAIAASSTFGP